MAEECCCVVWSSVPAQHTTEEFCLGTLYVCIHVECAYFLFVAAYLNIVIVLLYLEWHESLANVLARGSVI